MLVIGQCRIGVGHEDKLVVQHHGVARRGFAANIREGADDDNGIDAGFAQTAVDVGGSLNKGAVAPLDDNLVLRPHVKLGVKLEAVSAGSKLGERRPPRVAVEKYRPRFGLAFETHFHPHDLAAGGTGCCREFVHIGDDLACRGHFDRHAGQHEYVLQIDDHQRRLRAEETVVTVELAALRLDLGDDALGYGHFVHGLPPSSIAARPFGLRLIASAPP